MNTFGKEIPVANSTATRAKRNLPGLRESLQSLRHDPRVLQILATVLTTFSVFAIYLIQGIIVARILGATGRGEFGTALYFPRDILLWAGLLGAVEIVTGYAAKRQCNPVLLKYSAAKLGLITGSLTAIVAAVLSTALLVPTGKTYLIPYCLLCCLFVPFEHVHLTISSVDRGNESFFRYNVNRLIFALAFPVCMLMAWLVSLDQVFGTSWLTLTCLIWVFAKVVGLLPTLRDMDLFSGSKRSALLNQLNLAQQETVPGSGHLLKEGRPYAVSVFIAELFDRLDVFLILALALVIDSGYYFVAVPAAAMLIIAPNALGVFTFNAGARKDVNVSRSLAAKVLGATAVFQIAATLVFSLVIDDLIIFFFTEEFAPAIPFALWLLPASAMKGFQQAADGYLKGRGRPIIGVWARGISILVMLAFVALTFQRTGLLSIPQAACVGQAFSMVLITIAVFLNCDDPGTLTDTTELGSDNHDR